MKPIGFHTRFSTRFPDRAPTRPLTRVLIALATLILSVEWLGCSPPRTSTPQPPVHASSAVAWVGDQSIDEPAFLKAWSRRPQAKPDDVLGDLIREELFLAEIMRSGFSQRPDLRDAWRAFLIQRFTEEQRRRIASQAEPSAEDLAAYHRSHPDRFQSPARVQVAVLQVRPPSKNSAAPLSVSADLSLDRIRQRVLALPPEVQGFGPLAGEVSEHRSSRLQGGDLGWMTDVQLRAALPDAVVEAAGNLPATGQVSAWIATSRGHFLVKVLGREPAVLMPLDTVLERVRYECSQANRDAAEEALLATLRASIGVRTNALVLSRLSAPATSTAIASAPPSLPNP